MSYDVVVIGAGPGGYVAAIRAAQLGQKVACVEQAELGGVCLNWGCIPTKALIQSAHLRQEIAHAAAFGLDVGPVTIDWERVIKRSRTIATRLSRGVASLFKKYGVTHLAGRARIDRPGRVIVQPPSGDPTPIDTKHIIVATGARPRPFPGHPFDGELVWSSKEAMLAPTRPDSLIVLGAGAIGCEFAYFYNALGTKVTLVELAPRLLPIEDDESGLALAKAFTKQGIDVRTATKADAITIEDGRVHASLLPVGGSDSETIVADRILIAIGIQGHIDDLGLKEAGVEVDARRGQIVVDAHGRTTAPGIWAIGDVAAPPALAHKASAEGIHVAELIARPETARRPVDLLNIPSCTYCEPQVASVGLPERALQEQGIPYKIGKFPYSANGKALALEDKEGFAKVLFHAETGALLGAHLFGSAATELIAESVLVRSAELTEEDILNAVHAHPTLSEAFQEAVGQAFGASVNF